MAKEELETMNGIDVALGNRARECSTHFTACCRTVKCILWKKKGWMTRQRWSSVMLRGALLVWCCRRCPYLLQDPMLQVFELDETWTPWRGRLNPIQNSSPSVKYCVTVQCTSSSAHEAPQMWWWKGRNLCLWCWLPAQWKKFELHGSHQSLRV